MGTNPEKPDTDGDGVNDFDETENGTDPNDPDSDNDGLDDGEELKPIPTPLIPILTMMVCRWPGNRKQTNPNPDTDGDGTDGFDQLPLDPTKVETEMEME